MSENVWWVKDGALAIASYDSSTGDVTSIDTSSKTIRIHYNKRPSTFASTDLTKKVSELTGNSNFPDEFSYGIVCRALQRCSEIKANPQMAQYYKGEYLDYVARAKRYSNKGRVGTAYEIRGADY